MSAKRSLELKTELKTDRASEIRWAVEVTYWSHGKIVDKPFLAGRFYFDSYDGVYRSSTGEYPPVATFDTRALARRRCALIRGGPKYWKTTARPVKVRVTVTLEVPK